MKSEIISIITPSYNQAKFIGKTIESVITQKGNFYIDYVIQDGASNDGSVDVIKDFEKEVKRGEVVTKEGLEFYKNDNNLGISYRWESVKDSGQSEAINNAFNKAIGDLTGWVNSDDTLLPGTLQIVYEQYNLHKPIRVFFGGTIAYDQEGNELWRDMPPKISLYEMLYKKRGIPQPSVFFTVDLFKSVGGLDRDLRYMLDTDLWLKFMLKKIKFIHINQYLSTQLYHPGSKSSEGEYMFQAFEPEQKKIQEHYFKEIGLRNNYYQGKLTIIALRKKMLIAFLRPFPRKWKDFGKRVLHKIKRMF